MPSLNSSSTLQSTGGASSMLPPPRCSRSVVSRCVSSSWSSASLSVAVASCFVVSLDYSVDGSCMKVHVLGYLIAAFSLLKHSNNTSSEFLHTKKIVLKRKIVKKYEIVKKYTASKKLFSILKYDQKRKKDPAAFFIKPVSHLTECTLIFKQTMLAYSKRLQ